MEPVPDEFTRKKNEIEQKRVKLLQHLQSKPADRQAYFALLRSEQTLYDWLRILDSNPAWVPSAKSRESKLYQKPKSNRGRYAIATDGKTPAQRFAGASSLPAPVPVADAVPQGRAWTSPAYVQVVFDGPTQDGTKRTAEQIRNRRDAALKYFKRFVTSDVDRIVADWAKASFGSVNKAVSDLRVLCSIIAPADGVGSTPTNRQLDRIRAARTAWCERLKHVQATGQTGTIGGEEISQLISKLLQLEQALEAEGITENWRAEARTLLEEPRKGKPQNLVYAIAGLNMATKGERSDTILAYYAKHVHSKDREGDVIVKHVKARVSAYISGLNGDQPLAEFPYLTSFIDVDPVQELAAYLHDYFEMDEVDRLRRPNATQGQTMLKGEKRSEHLERFAKLYHAAFSRQSSGLKDRKGWGNRTHLSGLQERRGTRGLPRHYIKGEADKTKWAVIVWDMFRKAPVLLLHKGGEEINFNTLCLLDGSPIDERLAKHYGVQNGIGKGMLLELKIGHDFRRWWRANISNDDPNAPSYRRAVMKSFKMCILDPEDEPDRPAKVFLQPSFQFNEGERKPRIPGTKNQTSDVKWLIGIDWGINFPIFASVIEVSDPCKPKIVCVKSVSGADKIKSERRARERIAEANRQLSILQRKQRPAEVDEKRWRREQESRLHQARQRLRRARAAIRSVNALDVVEAVARLVGWIDGDQSSNSSPQQQDPLRAHNFAVAGKNANDYIIVVEDLTNPVVPSLKRVQTLRAVRDALRFQLRRRGFPARKQHRRAFPYGLEEVNAAGTSKLGLSRWKKESKPRLNEAMPTGRDVGGYISSVPTNGVYRRGERKWVGKGKSVFDLGQSACDGSKPQSFGQELFWDPELKAFSGVESEHGLVLRSDFIASVNIALRLLAQSAVPKKGGGSGQPWRDAVEEEHKRLLANLSIECRVDVWIPVIEQGRLVGLKLA